ncbi:MAG: NADH-quinone oxidoreductase subunit M [Candidatus Dasytiphilus stammeri]
MPLLWLIMIPFISSILCWQTDRFARWIALLASGIILIISLSMWLTTHHTTNLILTDNDITNSLWQYEYTIPWIPRFGINFHLASDGLSLLMVNVTALLSFIAILSSWEEKYKFPGKFFFHLLLVLCGVIGVFISLDLFLFFCFWEMILVPMYFLIALWGHEKSKEKTRIKAATKYFLYTQTSGLFMLIGIISLVLINYSCKGIYSFSYENLLHTHMSNVNEYLLMLCFFIAFAIKLPIVPLHGWMLDTQSQTPTAGSVDLIGILVKTAAYGILRFCLPLFPTASMKFSPIAMWLGIVTIFYGAWMAFSQTDMKRLIAYSSVSHMGFILIAMYTGNKLAYQGVIIQLITYSLSAGGLFLICGQIYNRLHTRNMYEIGGLWEYINYMPAFALFFSLATMGMPGTGNFIGEFLLLLGSYNIAPYITILASFGLIFSMIYLLIMMQHVFFGMPKNNFIYIKKMTVRESFILILIIFILIILCFYPNFILTKSSSDLNYIIQQWVK